MRGDSGYRSASMVSVNRLRSASVSSWVRSSCISESSHGHLFERGGRGDRLCAHTASRDRATPAGIWEMTFAGNGAQLGRQVSVVRAVQSPRAPIIDHQNSASIPTRTSAAVVSVASSAMRASSFRVGNRAMNSRSSAMAYRSPRA